MKRLFYIICIGVLLAYTSCSQSSNTPLVQKTEINTEWTFRNVENNNWLKADVPGCVHTDLLSNNLIEDPFYRMNEHDLQWIDKTDWEYKTSILADETLLANERIQLNFKGLDTYADVYLNDELILKADNMFRGWIVDCKDKLKVGDNELRVYFHSPIKVGLDIYDNYPYVVQSSANDLAKIGKVPGEKWVSPHVRKAPYHFGWDWGPRLVTSGIWEPIVMEAWNAAKIVDVHTRQKQLNETKASLSSEFEIEANSVQNAVLSITVNGKELSNKKVNLESGTNKYSVDFEIDNPQLWWSNGAGEAHLYEVKAELKTTQGADSFSHNLGLRTVELVTEKDEIGKSFYFKINGEPVFMKGANYIPNDVFLDRVSPEKYEHIVKSAHDCNFNMLRVWGGGIYEKKIFYDLCDKYGILVWQDFMFACNMYPGHPEFLESVKQEAIYNVKRLRNHPSIALWCGNNEILGAWFGWGWKRNNERDQPHGAKAMWQAYKDIFIKVLPEAVDNYDPDRYYWASSPQAGDTIRTSKIDGDDHDWRIWFSKVPFITYHDNTARFVSEYGFQSFPELKTVKKYALPEDYDIYSDVMKSHQRSFIGNGTIKFYLERDYQKPKDFESFLYAGLVLQAEGIKTGIEGHRLNMPRTMGSLYWQLNDVWPAASWSSIDYYGTWKALQYFTKHAFNPVVLIPDTKTEDLLIYSVSDRFEDFKGTLKLRILDFTGKVLWEQNDEISIEANTSNVIFKKNLKEVLKGLNPKEIVLDAQLFEGENKLHASTEYFELVKELNLPEPNVSCTVEKSDKGYKLTVSTDVLAKNIFFSYEEHEGFFTDNYFDLLPGETRMIYFESNEKIDSPEKELKIRTIRDTY